MHKLKNLKFNIKNMQIEKKLNEMVILNPFQYVYKYIRNHQTYAFTVKCKQPYNTTKYRSIQELS